MAILCNNRFILAVQNFTFLIQCIMSFVWRLKKAAIISLHSFVWPVFVSVKESLMFVPCIIRRSRNDQQYALICTNPLFYVLAATCFGSSLSSSGSFLDPSELLEIQIEWVVYHIMCGYMCPCAGLSWFHKEPRQSGKVLRALVRARVCACVRACVCFTSRPIVSTILERVKVKLP
jgi:hypothetical protein